MKERRGLDWIFLGSILVVAFLLSRMQASAIAAGQTDVVSRFVRSIFMPVGAVLRGPATSLAGGFSDIFSAGALRSENDQLRREKADMKLAVGEREALVRENQRLRDLLKAPNYGRVTISGEITGYFPFQQRITVNRGSNDKVKAGMAVVSDGSLLAVVQTVDASRCQALLISSPALSVGAAINGELPVAGITRGDRPGRLIFDFVDPVPVKPGASVVTSGFSDMIPAGIPIGDVSEVRDDRDYGTRRAFVVPTGRVASGREVLIVR
ncbi:MAG: rod shape-determining protein MreC [Fimbriimonadaceae bacterium]|nr:rod shape-determining protein MreC [Fimbriimonadaceae bacterium]